MAFTTKDWKDYPDTSTPITAAALEDLETRVTNYAESENAHLKLLTAADRKIAWGTVTVSFGAATNGWNGGQSSITHGLGATPAVVIAVPKTGGSLFDLVAVNWGITTIGGTTFDLYAHVKKDDGSDANTNSMAFYWLAIA